MQAQEKLPAPFFCVILRGPVYIVSYPDNALDRNI
jgi:hypothetical protein